jgi:hypothetical protein
MKWQPMVLMVAGGFCTLGGVLILADGRSSGAITLVAGVAMAALGWLSARKGPATEVRYISVRRRILTAVTGGVLFGAFQFAYALVVDERSVLRSAITGILMGLFFGVFWGLLWSAHMMRLYRRSQDEQATRSDRQA